MAKKLIPSVQEQKDPQGFPALLASAVYEWFLIFLLFVNALFSYLVTKFARFCKLQPPCMLCSKLDHVVCNENPGFYKNYLCNAHKLEISSLVFCPIHDKLADVHGMCEGCLFSFATEKKSNSEAYKLLVGKLGSELYRCRDQDSLVKNSLCKSHCSCCNDTWTSRTYFHKLLQTKSLGAQVAERETPSPGSAGHSRVRDNLKKRNRKQSGQKEWSYLRSRSFDPLSHIGYSELKITSESESEVPFSDEDDASGLVHEADGIKEEFAAQSVQLKAHTTDPQTVFKTPHDLAQEELIYQASIPRPSLSVSHEQLDVVVPHDVQSSTSTVAIPRPSLLVSDEQLNVAVPHDVQSSTSTVAIPRPPLLVSDEQLDVGVPHDVQSSTSTVVIPRPSLLVSDEQLDVGVPHDMQSSASTVAIPRPSLLVSDEQLNVGVPHDVQSSTSTVAIPRPSLLVSDEQLNVAVPHDVQSSTSTVAIPRPPLLVSDEQLDVGVPHDVQSSTSTVVIPRPSLLVSDEQLDVGVPHDMQSSASTVAIPRPSLLVSDEQLNVGVPHDVQSSTSTVAIPRPSLSVSDEQLDVGVPHDVQSSTSTVAIPRPSLLVSDEQLDVGVPHDMQSSTSTVAIPSPSLLVSDEQLDVSVPLDVQSSTSTVAIGHGLEELKWHQAERQIELPSPPEFISLKDVPAPLEFVSLKDIPLPSEIAEVSGKTLITIGDGDSDQLSVTEAGEVAKLETDLVMPTEPCLTMSRVVEVSEGICAADVAVIADNGQTSVIESVELHKLENGEIHNLERGLSTTSGPCSKTEQVLNDAGPPVPNLVGLTDAYKVAVGNKSQVSSMLAEQLTGKDSTRVTEDLKLLLSQVSAARGIELSSNEMSPRIHVHGEESKDSDSSSSMRLQFLPKRVSMERNEFGSESLDGSIVSEIEGESVVDRLKRQVEYDWKSMSALYKELEEERNASAIAANQAMAMITRLQEEKASLHMEALQYLRMMEEQAEYDVDELQKANDLLVDKEKEIQDLEYELEMYRRKFSNESMDENIQEPWCDLNGEDMGMELPDESCIGLDTNLPCNSLVGKESEGSNVYEKNDMVNGDHCMSDVKDSLLNFEDERIYISECLKKMEKQLHLVSTNGVHGDLSNGGYSVKESHGTSDLDQPHCREENHGNGQLQEDEASVQKDSSIDGPSTQESCNPSVGNSQFVIKENHHSDSDGQDSITDVGTPLAVIENEFSDLNERLDALEADRTFLEHAINALQSGDEGVKFLKEIALHLRELRRFGIRRGDQTVA